MRVLYSVILVFIVQAAYGQIIDTTLWSTDGEGVYAMKLVGDKLYIGGRFDNIGPSTGCLSVVKKDESYCPDCFPKIPGRTDVLVSDGEGGAYAIGLFNDNNPGFKILHINSQFEIDKELYFDDGTVSSASKLAQTKDSLYIITPSSHWSLRILSKKTGKGRSVFNHAANLAISDIKIKDNTAYLLVNGKLKIYDTDTWTEKKPPNLDVLSQKYIDIDIIEVSDKHLYVYGNFYFFVNDQERTRLASFNINDYSLTDWKPEVDSPNITDILYKSGRIFFSGSFAKINGVSRNGIASVNAETGQLYDWYPDREVFRDSRLLEFGDSLILAPGKNMLLKVDLYNGETRQLGLHPSYLHNIGVVEVNGAMLVGGNYNSLYSVRRRNLACIDMKTGRATSWNPQASDVVYTLEHMKGKIVVGGRFTKIGNTGVSRLAMVDTVDGLLTDWRPRFDNSVYTVINCEDSILVVGGSFLKVNSIARNFLVSFNMNAGGELTNWTPKPDDYINSICYGEGKLIVSGDFRVIGNSIRPRLVAYDTDSWTLNSWSPAPNARVGSMSIRNDKLLVTGSFDFISGVKRHSMAIYDLNTFEMSDFCVLGYDIYDRHYWDGETLLTGLKKKNQWRLDFKYMLVKINTRTSVISYVYPAMYNNFLFDKYKGRYIMAGNGYWWHPYKYGDVSGSNLLMLSDRKYEGTITGKIFRNDEACEEASGSPIKNIIVKAENKTGRYFASSDASGAFTIESDPGQYDVAQVFNEKQSSLIRSFCPDPAQYSVEITPGADTIKGKDFINRVTECSLLEVDICTFKRRICTSSGTAVSVCNNGSIDAYNVLLKVIIPKGSIPVRSSLEWDYVRDSMLVFTIPKVDAFGCYSFSLIDSVECDLNLVSKTMCVKAYLMTKDENSCNNDPGRSYQSVPVQINSWCQDNTARFSVKQTLNESHKSYFDIRLFENDTLVYKERKSRLSEQDSLVLNYPLGNNTVRLNIDCYQTDDKIITAQAVVEPCNSTPAFPKLSNSAFQHDAYDDFEVHCQEVVYSFDPNDKQVSPIGTGPEGFVNNTDILEYILRFQNTGSDTAYKVVVIDTLDVNLDIHSFRQGICSHDYMLKVSGKDRPVLTWTFDNIFLPDSATNPDGSCGFIKFAIAMIPNLPVGTVIENKAAIFFDINEPVITNQTINTIGDSTRIITNYDKGGLVTFGDHLIAGGASAQWVDYLFIYPNPANESSQLEVRRQHTEGKKEVVLLSYTGSEIARDMFYGSKYPIKKILPEQQGIYFVRVIFQDKSAVLKMIVK